MITLTSEVDRARRVAFLLASAEDVLNLQGNGLQLAARIANVMDGAMADPSAVDATKYRIFYRLADIPVEPAPTITERPNDTTAAEPAAKEQP